MLKHYSIAFKRDSLFCFRYLVSSYLRLRLKKIQDFIFTLNLESGPLSKEEKEFAKSYKAAMIGHFDELALKHMPANFKNMPDPKKVQPKMKSGNLDSFVFASVLSDVGSVIFEDPTNMVWKRRSCEWINIV